jgi:hypothetical protein
MAWIIYFWAIAAVLVLPLPFKVIEYISGKDKSPMSVKIEEMTNAVFFFVGLVGLYGFVYNVDYLSPLFWRIWIVLAVVLSIAAIFWSPKLKYAVNVMGKTRTRIVVGIGSLAFVPMLVGLFIYSSGT